MNPVPLPLNLATRPRWHGMAVPYITAMAGDGTPMFRTNDERRRQEVIAHRWCGMCGRPLGPVVVFIIGGEVCVPFYALEPAQHEKCTRYVLAVCPYFAAAGYVVRHRPLRNLAPTQHEMDVPSEPEGPRRAGHERIGLWFTTDYRTEVTPAEGLVVVPGPARKVEWVDLP